MTATHANPTTAQHIASIYRYPIKGLSPQQLDAVSVEAGGCMPFDRAYAIENGAGRFDPLTPQHLPKINFLMLMRDQRLASLHTEFDAASQTVTIFRDGNQVATGQLNTPVGRQLIEQFLSSYFTTELRGAPKIVAAPGHSFSDVPAKCLHIVNLASVRDLERIAGRAVDPLRFRANIYIDGLEPWQEFNWLDKRVRVGSASLKVFTRTERCDATNVDPSTAQRDMSIPSLLRRQWGHCDFGVYAKVETGGDMAAGDTVTIE